MINPIIQMHLKVNLKNKYDGDVSVLDELLKRSVCGDRMVPQN